MSMANPLRFDFIVVGAGSAGCAVAARLAENNHTVLLLEAGKDDGWFWIKVPLGVGRILVSERALWRFFTEPEPYLNGRPIYWPRGRVLGGSSSVNGMIWARGEPAEYDHWADLGIGGWSYRDVAPVFDRIEGSAGTAPLRGSNSGRFPIVEYNPPDILSDAFLSACKEAGIPETPDYNRESFEGAGYLQFNASRGLRHGSREAYLTGGNRKNIVVSTGAHARRILLNGRRAIGVEYQQGGRVMTALAEQEVVVACGTIKSPQLLEMSGVGAASILRQHGVDVVHDLPGVGENCRDHVNTRLSFQCTSKVTLNDILQSPARKYWMGARYLLFRNGLMSSTTCTAHALARSEVSSDRPDVKIQIHHLSSDNPRHPTELRLDPYPGFSIGTFMLRPESQGSVHIASPDPTAQPKIQANYLASAGDRETCVAALRLARKVAEQPALSRFIVRETRPGPSCQSEDEFLGFIAEHGTTSYHPIGTCRMGRGDDRLAVVDDKLRVHGMERLRVADASVMPTMVSPNTNAPSIMIGERCADFIMQAGD